MSLIKKEIWAPAWPQGPVSVTTILPCSEVQSEDYKHYSFWQTGSFGVVMDLGNTRLKISPDDTGMAAMKVI